MEEMIILGSGGHGQSVADAVERQGKYRIAGFVGPEENKDRTFSDYRLIGGDEDLDRIYAEGIRHAFVAVGYLGRSDIRQQLFARLTEIGFHIPAVIDPSAVIARDVRVEAGVFVGKNAVVNTGARLGKMCIVNTGAIVEHGCRVGDFSHIAVGAILCGQVSVGQGALIGAGATILQERNVGAGAIAGAGCVVRRNVGEGEVIR